MVLEQLHIHMQKTKKERTNEKKKTIKLQAIPCTTYENSRRITDIKSKA